MIFGATMEKAVVHFHQTGEKQWACGATTGQASGDLGSVNCEECIKSHAFTQASEELAQRIADYDALSKPKK